MILRKGFFRKLLSLVTIPFISSLLGVITCSIKQSNSGIFKVPFFDDLKIMFSYNLNFKNS